MCSVALSMLDLSGAMLVSETLLETSTSNHNAPKHTRRGKRKRTWPVHELMHWAQENVPKKEHANVFDAGRYPLTITVAHRDCWHHAPKTQKLYTYRQPWKTHFPSVQIEEYYGQRRWLQIGFNNTYPPKWSMTARTMQTRWTNEDAACN
jgi:hypothetical protein